MELSDYTLHLDALDVLKQKGAVFTTFVNVLTYEWTSDSWTFYMFDLDGKALKTGWPIDKHTLVNEGTNGLFHNVEAAISDDINDIMTGLEEGFSE